MSDTFARKQKCEQRLGNIPEAHFKGGGGAALCAFGMSDSRQNSCRSTFLCLVSENCVVALFFYYIGCTLIYRVLFYTFLIGVIPPKGFRIP